MIIQLSSGMGPIECRAAVGGIYRALCMEYPEPLQDYALTQITRGIQSGLYPMGSKLAPQRIAQTLGISSTCHKGRGKIIREYS